MVNTIANMKNPFAPGMPSIETQNLIAQNKMKNSSFYGPNVGASIRSQQEQADRNSPNPYRKKWMAKSTNGTEGYVFPNGMSATDGFKIVSFATKGEADDYMRGRNSRKESSGPQGQWSAAPINSPNMDKYVQNRANVVANQRAINAAQSQSARTFNNPDYGAYKGDIQAAYRDFQAMNRSDPSSKYQFKFSTGNDFQYVLGQMQQAISNKLKRGEPITDAERQVLYS